MTDKCEFWSIICIQRQHAQGFYLPFATHYPRYLSLTWSLLFSSCRTLGTVRSVRNCILVSTGMTTLPLTTVDSYLQERRGDQESTENG